MICYCRSNYKIINVIGLLNYYRLLDWTTIIIIRLLDYYNYYKTVNIIGFFFFLHNFIKNS